MRADKVAEYLKSRGCQVLGYTITPDEQVEDDEVALPGGYHIQVDVIGSCHQWFYLAKEDERGYRHVLETTDIKELTREILMRQKTEPVRVEVNQ